MLNLYIVDALDHCPTFRKPLSPELVGQTVLHDDPSLFHMEDNLFHLKEKEGDTELTLALSECVENYRRQRVIRMMSEQGKDFFSATPWQACATQHRNTLFKSLWPVWGSWLTRESIKEELKRLSGRKNRDHHAK